MLKTILTILLLISCAHSNVKPKIHKFDLSDPYIFHNGKITRTSVFTPEAAAQFKKIEALSGEELHVVVNSHGGRTDVLLAMIEKMDELKDKGVIIKCFLKDNAMSSAFAFAANCDKRYSDGTTKLLTHHAWAVGQFRINTPNLEVLVEDFKKTDEKFFAIIKRSFNPDMFDWLNREEVVFSVYGANQLVEGWIECPENSSCKVLQ